MRGVPRWSELFLHVYQTIWRHVPKNISPQAISFTTCPSPNHGTGAYTLGFVIACRACTVCDAAMQARVHRRPRRIPTVWRAYHHGWGEDQWINYNRSSSALSGFDQYILWIRYCLRILKLFWSLQDIICFEDATLTPVQRVAHLQGQCYVMLSDSLYCFGVSRILVPGILC
jgi:hypothetical protein